MHAFVVAVALTLSSTPPSSAACDVTLPNHSVPPEQVLRHANVPGPANPQQWPVHGDGTLWVSLWTDGTVTFRKGGPGFVEPDGALKMKFFWMLATDGPLSVSGKRVDGDAGPLRSEIPTGFIGAHYQPSYLVFPTEGCWEVTAKANGSELTFVTKVVKTY